VNFENSIFFMKTHAHEIDLNVSSELGNGFTLKNRYFFMKTHESALGILESYLNWETGEFLNYYIFP
jgi:hypothetical protein